MVVTRDCGCARLLVRVAAEFDPLALGLGSERVNDTTARVAITTASPMSTLRTDRRTAGA